MAPILTAAVGITPQIIDDDRLCQLRNDLFDLELKVPLGRSYSTSEEIKEPLDINRLVSIVKPWKTWVFEEQVRTFWLLAVFYKPVPRLNHLSIISPTPTQKLG